MSVSADRISEKSGRFHLPPAASSSDFLRIMIVNGDPLATPLYETNICPASLSRVIPSGEEAIKYYRDNKRQVDGAIIDHESEPDAAAIARSLRSEGLTGPIVVACAGIKDLSFGEKWRILSVANSLVSRIDALLNPQRVVGEVID